MSLIIGKDLLATALLKAQESLEPLSNRGWGGEMGHNEVELIINAGREALTGVGLVLSILGYNYEDRPTKPPAQDAKSQQHEQYLVSSYELIHATSGRAIPYRIELPVKSYNDPHISLDRSLAILIRGFCYRHLKHVKRLKNVDIDCAIQQIVYY